MKFEIPEFEQILKNQEKIMQMITKFADTPPPADLNDEQLMTGPEILHFLRCGRKKLNELIEAGKVEKINAFGTRPRYKILKHYAA